MAPGLRRWLWVIAVIGAWQLGWAVDVIPPIGLPSPFEIGVALWQLLVSGELWFHLEATLPRLGLGWGGGTALALLACRAAGSWTGVGAALTAVVSTAALVPAIALLPLFMIWLGVGEGAMVGTIGLAAFAAAAHKTVGRTSEPWHCTAISALRAALPGAMTALVAVEMIGGGFGIGALVFAAAELYRSDQIIAGCIVLAAIALILGGVLNLAERAAASDKTGVAKA